MATVELSTKDLEVLAQHLREQNFFSISDEDQLRQKDRERADEHLRILSSTFEGPGRQVHFRQRLICAAVTGLLSGHPYSQDSIGAWIKRHLGTLAIQAAESVLAVEIESAFKTKKILNNFNLGEDPIQDTPEANSDGEPPIDESPGDEDLF